MTCGSENGTNESHLLAVLIKDVAFARHYVAPSSPPTLPLYRSASGIGYASKYLSNMAGNLASYPLYSRHSELP